MWLSYHSGTIFEHFGRWNIRCYLGGVLGGFWGGFSKGFGCQEGFFARVPQGIEKERHDNTLRKRKPYPGTTGRRVKEPGTKGKRVYMDFRGPARGGI